MQTRRALIAAIMLLLSGAAGAWWLAPDAPEVLMERVRIRLADARAARADRLAPEPYLRAEAAWNEALDLLRAESTRPAPLRSYDALIESLERAGSHADEAVREAAYTTDSLHAATRSALDRQADRHRDLERAATFYPAGIVDSRDLLRSRVQRSLAETALEMNQLTDAHAHAARAVHIADSLMVATRRTLRAHLEPVGRWVELADSLDRARHRPYVLVDKAAHSMTIVDRGQTTTYSIELGAPWLGTKRMAGDRATPEGLYRVKSRKAPPQTRYHRALLLDYPNADDRRRFDDLKDRGAIPRNARIGGLIEIHGGGGRSADWTDGCIALTDAEVERVFARLPVGTPVLIAGSFSDDLPLLHD